jgi:hypothetical protein
MNRFLLTLSVLISTAQIASASPSHAQVKDPNVHKMMWQPNIATNFDLKPKANSSKEISFADKPLGLPNPEEEGATQVASQQPAEKTNPVEQATPAAEPTLEAGKLKTREEIYKKFGSPTDEVPVKAIKDAPAPHQALFECVRIKDEKCAVEFAVQAAKFDRQVQETVAKVTEMRLMGQEVLGMRESPQDVGEPMSPERAKALKYLEEAKKQLAESPLDVNKMLGDETGESEDLAEKSIYHREKLLNQTPKTPVPLDPQGKAHLLVFFDERIYPGKDLNESLKPLKKLATADKNLKILGLTAKSYSPVGLKRVGATTEFPFPLMNGEALSKDLLISRYPTFIFVAPTIKQQYRLEGLRSAEEIEKVIRLMMGGGGTSK